MYAIKMVIILNCITDYCSFLPHYIFNGLKAVLTVSLHSTAHFSRVS